MTIQEMHIALDLGLQEVNSEIENDFGPNEKDMFLNDEIKKFVSDRISPKSNVKGEGFDRTKKRLDDLQNLKTSMNLPMYVSTELAHNNSVYTYLPADFLHEVETIPAVFYDCNKTVINQTASSYKYYSYSLQNNYTYTVFIIEVLVNGVWTTIFNAANIDNLTAGILPDYKFYIKELVKDYINKNFKDIIEVAWEEFGDLYFNNRLIFINRNNAVTQIRITTNSTITAPFQTVNKQIFNLTGKTVKAAEYRLYSSEEVGDRLRDSFTATKFSSVVGEVADNRVIAYHSDFYIQTINFKYLRKPQYVNSMFNINCDIKEDFHHEIVSNTITLIKSLINTNTYKQYQNENLKIE